MKSLMYVIIIFLLGTTVCLAQEPETSEQPPETQKLGGFDWLKQLEGTWAVFPESGKANAEPESTLNTRALGNQWIVNEHKGKSYQAIQTIGYDSKKNQFRGNWIDSNTSFNWSYTGELDESGKKLTLNSEGPDMANWAKMTRYRDVYEFTSENEYTYKSQVIDDREKWKTFMSGKIKKISPPNAHPTVTPFLMFTGKAEEAIEFYKTVFAETKVESMAKYKAGESGKEGTIQLAIFSIEGQRVKCIDSPPVHDFTFTPSFSFFVDCKDEAQLKKRFEQLSEGGKVMMPVNNYGFSKQFGWTSDKFGVSWQLNLK